MWEKMDQESVKAWEKTTPCVSRMVNSDGDTWEARLIATRLLVTGSDIDPVLSSSIADGDVGPPPLVMRDSERHWLRGVIIECRNALSALGVNQDG